MAYSEIIPADPALHPLVECFWVNQSDRYYQPVQRIVPDGCVDIIYRLPVSQLSVPKKQPGQSLTPILVGTMTQPIMAYHQPMYNYLGIRFRPGGIAAFIDKPLYAFTDAVCPIDAVQPILGTFIQRQLAEEENWPGRISLLETHFTNSLRLPLVLPTAFPAVVQYLLDKNGQTSLLQLSQVANRSPRQVERLFLQYVGVSPKLLARIVRFRYVKALLDSGTTDSLMGIAFDNGYTDHAHLTKEFKAFAGLTPSAYAG